VDANKFEATDEKAVYAANNDDPVNTRPDKLLKIKARDESNGF